MIKGIVAMLAVSLAGVTADDTCAVSDNEKIDCGFTGITSDGCLEKSCCWQSSTVDGVPWCYYQAGAKATSCYGFMSTMDKPFSSDEMATMRQYFMDNINIQGNGGVVAAPDYNTPGGSYYYHWMRDGALTMRCLQDTYVGNFSDIEMFVKNYAQWVLHNQAEVDPNGIDIRTEPKFELPNGEVFTGAWCRPQNDGPGLRATALIQAANNLIDAGEMDYVKQYLWTGDSSVYNGGAIKFDLDYVMSNYMTNTCDLWEEIMDENFFWNRYTMRKAMIMGMQFATQMGNAAVADQYSTALGMINASIYSSHWNGAFVQETQVRTRDAAVIVGFNDGYDSYDDMFAPTDIEVAMTVSSYNTMFCSQYTVNANDYFQGLPGVLYGRYQGDTYAGGNPWVLSTGALASLFYRGANYILANGVPSVDALDAWQTAFNTDAPLPTDAASLAAVFAAQGDGVLKRLYAHVKDDGFHLDEQIDRNTGKQMSAKDLTWSYAEVLNAMYQRSLYTNNA